LEGFKSVAKSPCTGFGREVYKITKEFPKQEMFGLVSQLRRSSSSITTNIVEGQSRNTTKEYLQFLYNSRGSVEETRYHLLLSKDLGYIDNTKYISMENRYEEVSKMLNALIKRIKGLRDKD
jgi:four helix bundle protein